MRFLVLISSLLFAVAAWAQEPHGEIRTKFNALKLKFNSPDTHQYEIRIKKSGRVREAFFKKRGSSALTWCSSSQCMYYPYWETDDCESLRYQIKLSLVKAEDTMLIELRNIPTGQQEIDLGQFQKGRYSYKLRKARQVRLPNPQDSSFDANECFALNCWVYGGWKYEPEPEPKRKKKPRARLFRYNWKSRRARELRGG